MTPAFLQLNPKHKVPVLVIDGRPLTENVALQIWIARQFPAAQLLPSDAQQEIEAISFIAWCASTVHPSLTPNALPQRYCDLPGAEDNVRQCAQRLLRDHYAVAEQRLGEGEWFFDHYTAADAYFFWCFRRGGQFGMDLGQFPRCSAHMARVLARPATQRLLALETQTLEAFAKA